VDLPAIPAAAYALYEPVLNQPVHKSDGSVVANHQVIGELSDIRPLNVGESTDGQQDLVLLRLKSFGAGCCFTEVQKLADLISELA
jgi:hypothetical protein